MIIIIIDVIIFYTLSIETNTNRSISDWLSLECRQNIYHLSSNTSIISSRYSADCWELSIKIGKTLNQICSCNRSCVYNNFENQTYHIHIKRRDSRLEISKVYVFQVIKNSICCSRLLNKPRSYDGFIFRASLTVH